MDELMGSLKTFNLNLVQRKSKKSIAFKTMQEAEDESEKEDDAYALLFKNFNKFFEKMGKKTQICL